MVEDPNVVFVLRAMSEQAKAACKLAHNKKYYKYCGPVAVSTTCSEVSTPHTNVGDDEDDQNRSHAHHGDGRYSDHQLRFTFDRMPNNLEQGWVFGSNPKKCDVLLGTPKKGISGVHCRITYNQNEELVLIDQSTHGTAVNYDGQGWDEKRNNRINQERSAARDPSFDFLWILFPDIRDKRVLVGHLIDELPDAPIFEVSVVNEISENIKERHAKLRDSYMEAMRSVMPFSLDINSQITTAGHTSTHSPQSHPRQQPIWIHRALIGSGAYGNVYLALNVSTGKICAAKVLVHSRPDILPRWEKEIAILRSTSHEHIVKFEYNDHHGESPRLIMEYHPLGNLANQNGVSPITQWETVTVTCQGLDALKYLHSLNIVHRDLKPENILVHVRGPARFLIKIADFGLAQDQPYMETHCGTPLYSAPEIEYGLPYTSKVDLWSLGVVALQYGHGLPEFPEPYWLGGINIGIQRWHECLAQSAANCNSSALMEFLSSRMLLVNPHARLPADECLEAATEILDQTALVQNSHVDSDTLTKAISSSTIMTGLPQVERERDGSRTNIMEQVELPPLSAINDSWTPWLRERRELEEREREGTAADQTELPPPSSIHQPWALSLNEQFNFGSRDSVQELPQARTKDISVAEQANLSRLEEAESAHQQLTSELRRQDQILILDDNLRYIRMKVNGLNVNMRIRDYFLLATDMMWLAGCDENKRKRIRKILREVLGHVEYYSTGRTFQMWVPFAEGKCLCRYLRLEETLRPLLEYGERHVTVQEGHTDYLFERLCG